MSETKSSYCEDFDGAAMSLTATLLITNPPTKTSASASASGKYGRVWRRFSLVRAFISLSTTTATVNTSASASASGKYGRVWRRFLLVRVLISLSKTKQVSDPQPFPSCSHCAIDVHSDGEKEVDEHQFCLDPLVLKDIVKERNLQSLERAGGVEGVALVLDSNLQSGIDDAAHGSRSRISSPIPENSKGFIICNSLKSCSSSTIILLLISSGLSFAIEIEEQGPQYGWHDGVAILVAVFVIVTFRLLNNFHHQKTLEKQRWEKKNKLVAEVIRSGERHLLAVSDLVQGDLVILKKGCIVPADGLYADDGILVLDEVFNSTINRVANPFLFSGSKVIEGHGRMLVISAGANTASDDSKEKTLFEAQIEKPNSCTESLALFVTVIIAVIVLIRLLCKKQHKNDDILPDLKGNTKIHVVINIFENMFWRPRGRICILTGALTSIVIGMQHGMSVAITISLCYWKGKVESSGVKPQNLSACGTMGLVSVICINASSELICNKMEVNEFHVAGEDMDIVVVCETNRAVLEAPGQGIVASTDVPPSDLLVAWLNSRPGQNMELSESDQGFSVIDQRRHGYDKNYSRLVIEKNGDGEGILYMYLKGDASTILNLCSHHYNSMGQIQCIEDQRRKFEQVIEDMKSRGLKAIACACKQIENQESSEKDLQLLALVGLRCSCQKALKNAGVSIKLVSHNELSAVRDTACELGIISSDSYDVELEGKQIRDLIDSAEKIKKIEEAIVMGSCLSDDMLLIVKSLKQEGHIVAFFGGLTSTDFQALKAADLEITRENQSTEVARESSDIVVSDECSLESLLKVMKYGRCAYNNIQKFSQLQLITCISGLLINLVAATCSWDSPLTAIQLIWVNFIMCLLGSLMMVMELGSLELMANPPPDRAEPLVTKAVWKNIATEVLSQTSLLLALHSVGKATPSINEDIWKPLVFNSFMLCQVFNQFKAIGILSKEAADAVLHHHWLLWALGIVLAMQVVIVEFGTSLAGCKRLNLVHWAISFIVPALSWGLEKAMAFISDFLSNWFSRSHDSNEFGSSRRRMRPWSPVLFLVTPLSMIFLFSFSYYFYPNDVQVFRR